MREFIKAHAVANAVRMKRTQNNGAFLIVEGCSDKRVYQSLTDTDACCIEIAYGFENAIYATSELNRDNTRGVLAIVDADFTRICGDPNGEPNILRTDLHDLECMIVKSSALSKVLREFTEEERLNAFRSSHPDIGEHLATCAVPIGCFRLASLQRKYELKFEGIRFARFLSEKDLAVNIHAMIREVLNNSVRHDLDQHELAALVEAEVSKGHNPWQVACGHDMVEILSFALRKTLSGKSTGQVSTDLLEKSLRLAFDSNELRTTHFFREVQNWELQSGYDVWQKLTFRESRN